MYDIHRLMLLQLTQVTIANTWTILSKRFSFFQAYECLDESYTCINLITTHNVIIMTLAVLLFWAFYFFLWGSLYLRIYQKQQQYAFLKTFCFTVILGISNWCLSKNLKLNTLITMNLAVIGISSIALIFIRMLKLMVSPVLC